MLSSAVAISAFMCAVHAIGSASLSGAGFFSSNFSICSPFSPVLLSRSAPDDGSASQSGTGSDKGCSCVPSEMSSAASRISRSSLLPLRRSDSETGISLAMICQFHNRFLLHFQLFSCFFVSASRFLVSRINVVKLL